MSANMPGSGAVPLALLALCVLCCLEDVRSECPWRQTGLKKWSDPSTWGGSIPDEDSQLTIPSGTRVLLDSTTATLAHVIVEPNAALIWDDKDGIVLTTHYLLIQGEFHIGSEDCKFDKKAHIRLLGQNNTVDKYKHHYFGAKFIGVEENGVIELHGKNKTSWTSLAQTVKKPSELECGFVYNHVTSDLIQESPISKAVLVIVWKPDGSVMDYKTFSQSDETFDDFFISIPKGMVIGIHDGGGGLSSLMKTTIEGMGGEAVKNYQSGDHYSFIGISGDTASIQDFVNKADVKEGEDLEYLSLHYTANKLAFEVTRYATKEHFFRVLDESVAYPILTLATEVFGWEPGSEVMVTSTDYDWRQTEIRRILQCEECSKRQIRVNATFNYLHFGNFTSYVDERAEVAMLTRNILIEGIMSETCATEEDWQRTLCEKYDNRDTFGGHLRIERNHKAAHIEGVELVHMGQQGVLGSYPLHFHLCDNVPDSYIRQNTVHDSLSRCFTIHGTNELRVLDNVCYKHLGHGLFVEDAVEQNNTIRGNLVAGSMHGTHLLSDLEPVWCPPSYREGCGHMASYWITHPNNIIEGNVAAGGDSLGFTVMFSDLPLGPSRYRPHVNETHNPRIYPMTFNYNKAHSYRLLVFDMGTYQYRTCLDTYPLLDKKGIHIHNAGPYMRHENVWLDGIFMDGLISMGTELMPENGVIRGGFQYYPLINGTLVFVNVSELTSFKNSRTAIWIKGGNIRLRKSVMAEGRDGFSGGTSKMNSGSMIDSCIFIGETANKGYRNKRPNCNTDPKNQSVTLPCYLATLTGVVIYQGPVLIENSYFDRYESIKFCRNKSLTLEQCSQSDIISRYATAIGFKKGSTYPFMSSSFTRNNTFGYDDDETHHWVYQGADLFADYKKKDGNTMVYLADKDGKLTGIKNSAIVNDLPVYRGPGCQKRPTWGNSNLTVCPNRYIKLKILGRGGSLDPALRKQYPLTIWRNDPEYNKTFTMQGEIRNEFLLRTSSGFIVELNSSLPGAAFPDSYTLKGFGVEIQDQVRVGFCQPLDVEGYDIQFKSPFRHSAAIWKNSLAELDEDTTGRALFHDKDNGILFVKVSSMFDDNNATQRCPEGKCWIVNIEVKGGSRTKLRSCKDDLEKNGIILDDFVDNRDIFRKDPPEILNLPRTGSNGVIPKGVGPSYIENPGFVVHEDFSVACRSFTPASTPAEVGCYQKNRNAPETVLINKVPLDLAKAMSPEFCAERCYHRGFTHAALSVGKKCCCGNSIEGYSSADEGQCSQLCPANPSEKCGGDKQSIVNIWTTGK